MIETSTRFRTTFIPYFIITWPLIFLALWIPPFYLFGGGLFVIAGLLAGYPMWAEIPLKFLDYGAPFCYAMLIGGIILNLGNAVFLSTRQRYGNLQTALLTIRRLCVGLYPSLLWGILPAIFFLMGPDRNKHILFLIALSLPALNLSGAFYAVPLVLRLKKEGKISFVATILYVLFSFVIGFDLLATFYMRKKLNE